MRQAMLIRQESQTAECFFAVKVHASHERIIFLDTSRFNSTLI